MKIGSFEIERGAALAPMAGVTNPPFRRICREFGAVLSSTELISAHALAYLAAKPASSSKLKSETLSLIQRYEGERPFVVQIFGRDADKMAHAAEIAAGMGADIIDLNFACPARKVVKAGEGAGVALMLAPDLLQEIALRVVKAVPTPVTAKIRAGWSADKRNAPEVAKRLEDAGVCAICVHGRVRDQVHSGEVDVESIAKVCRAVGVPVIGNGGVRSPEDATDMMERTGCARVAVGQAARGNPWIFSALRGEVSKVDLGERLRVFGAHFDLYAKWAGEAKAAMEMRKHACWYFKGFVGAARLRERLSYARGADDLFRIIDSASEESADDT